MRAGLLLLLAAAGSSSPPPAAPVPTAPTIDPLSWRELLTGASFVGVVECQTAGEVEANFRVIDSWKGSPAGTSLRLRLATHSAGLRAPTVLVGERALVTAFAISPSRLTGAGSSGERVPLWLRKGKADGVLPLLQGFESLPLSPNANLLGTGEHTLEAAHAKARDFLALSPTEQEARILQEAASTLLPAAHGLHQALQSSTSAADSVVALRKLLRTSPSSSAAVAEVLSRGDLQTLAVLQNIPLDQIDPASSEALDAIRERHPPPKPSDPHPEPPPEPTPRMMEKMRDALADEDPRTWNGAISVLTVHDCDAVTASLLGWLPPARLPDFGFGLGSWVAWRCGTHRDANLAHLADAAADPWLRAWAASYLEQDDPTQGRPRLAQLAKLPGGPGDWAALELARRGDPSGMPRILGLLTRPGVPQDPLSTVLLRARAAALLSNSAATSHLAPPPIRPMRASDQVQVDSPGILPWWSGVSAGIHLADPWLPELDAEKVD